MCLDDFALGTIEWEGAEIEFPSCCAFVKYRENELTFLSKGFSDEDMDSENVYHVAKVWSIRDNGHGFEGYWLKMGWREIELADSDKRYLSDGRRFGF